MDEQISLPSSWAWATIDDIGIVASGSTPSTKEEDNFGGNISWLTPADLSNYDGKYIKKGKRNLTEKGLKSCSATLLPEGSILFSSRAPIGYTVIAANPISTNQGFKNLISFKEIFNEYIYHYLKGNKDLAESFASGTTFKELSARRFKKIPIPIPPFNEQVRIVSKIEELFSRLDQGVKALQQTQQQLELYQQSVLLQSFTGKLTEKWRINNSLKPITINKKIDVDISKLLIIPKEWKWYALGDYATLKNGINFTRSQKGNRGILTIAVKNMYSEGLYVDSSDLYRVDKKVKNDRILQDGDILFVRSSVKREGVGWTSLFKKQNENVTYCGFIIRAKIFQNDIDPKYLAYYCRTDFARDYLIGSSHQVVITNINQNNLSNLPTPIPPYEEQIIIVDIIERFMSVIKNGINIMMQNSAKIKSLKQSLLKKAFEGRLVPQDPTDEPASVLIKRIKNEKSKLKPNQKRGRKRGRKN